MGWLVPGLLMYTVLLPCVSCTPVRVLGLKGESIFLKAKIPPHFHVRETIWRVLSPSEELVAMFFKGTPEVLYQSRFYGRIQLHRNFTLEISPVDLEDSGVFSVLLVNTTGEIKKQDFRLVIYDKVSAPTIQVFTEERSQNSPAGLCHLFLTCTVTSRTVVTYNWTRSESKALARENHSILEDGQVLWIKLDLKEDLEAKYTCTAANGLTRASTTIGIQKYCQIGSEDPAESPFDYKTILLVVVPLASFLLSAGAILVAHSKWRTGKNISYAVSRNSPVPA